MNFWSVLKNIKRNSGLILLNTPIENFKTFKILWNNATTKVFLDGFANVIHSKHLGNVFIPDVVLGDFDSIHPDVLNQYKKMPSVKVIHTPDQNHTDLDKGLKYIVENYETVDHVIVYFKSGGRLDHTFAMFNSIFKFKMYSTLPVILVSECDIAVLLSPHKMEIDKEYAEGTCGLIPLGESVKVSTSGLKWNLDNSELKFGKLVSSSNYLLDSNEVSITCDNYLVWTMTYLYPKHVSNYGE